MLVQEGATDDTLYVITSGRLAVTRAVGGAQDVTLHVLRAGDLAGQMGFVDGRPHSATLRAVGEPTVCMIRVPTSRPCWMRIRSSSTSS